MKGSENREIYRWKTIDVPREKGFTDRSLDNRSFSWILGMIVPDGVSSSNHTTKLEEVSTHNRYSITYDDIFVVAPVPKQAAGSCDSQNRAGGKNPRTEFSRIPIRLLVI